MNAQTLKAFLEITKHASFTLAARSLGLTQPAISKRIDKLEAELGSALLERSGPQVTLTHAGESFVPHAQAVLLAMEDGRRAMQDLSGQVAGPLNIGTSHYIGLHKLPSYLLRFQESFPDVDLDIAFIDSSQAWDSVQRGTLELALITLPEQKDPQMEQLRLWDEQLRLVCHESHPLGLLDKVSRQDLRGYPCILPPHSTYPRVLFEQKLAQLKILPEQVKTANYLEIIAKMVASKLGWSILPESLISAPLKDITGTRWSMQRSLGLIHRARRPLSRPAQKFIELLQLAPDKT